MDNVLLEIDKLLTISNNKPLDLKVLSGEISPSEARASLDALFDFVKYESNIQKEKT